MGFFLPSWLKSGLVKTVKKWSGENLTNRTGGATTGTLGGLDLDLKWIITRMKYSCGKHTR